MRIKINGKTAAIKSGSSFEYVSENRLFSGSDGYTLSIEFPIKDCDQNLAIFGNLNRRDVALNTLRYNAELSDKGFSVSGTLTITKVSESVITGQFLEGRSAQNFDDSFDEIYINELPLGQPDDMSLDTSPEVAWHVGGNPALLPVALPWVNDTSDGAANNFATYNEKTEKFEWDDDTVDTEGLSYFVYLLPLVKKICEAERVGYTYDFSAWDASQWRYLLVCNALPYSWEIWDYNRVLPHWTLTELFEKIETLLNCEFDIDHRAKHITMNFTPDLLATLDSTRIDTVVDSFTTEVTADEHSADYLGAKNLKFKDPDYDDWSFMSCDWFIEDLVASGQAVQRFDTVAEVIAEAEKKRTYDTLFYQDEYRKNKSPNDIYYARDLNLYFVHKVDSKTKTWVKEAATYLCRYVTHLVPINMFGGRIVDTSDDADEEEIELVPVRVDETDDDHGLGMFLSPSSYSESYYEEDDDEDVSKKEKDLPFSQSLVYQTIANGDLDEVEYYSVLNVGFWDGELSFPNKQAVPHVAPLEIYPDWSYKVQDFMLQLNNPKSIANQVLTPINPKVKYTFSFLADTIPNVRGTFIIYGQKFICAKITATFTEDGMSQLLKGEFYPVAE